MKFNNMFQFQPSLPSHFAFQRTKIFKDNKSKLQINKIQCICNQYLDYDKLNYQMHIPKNQKDF